MSNSHKTTSFNLAVVLVTVIAISAFITAVLVFWPNAEKWFNSEAAWETVVKLFAGAILGGGIGLTYKYLETTRSERRESHEKEREKESIRRKSLEDFYRSLV
jgi:hypothetical protein